MREVRPPPAPLRLAAACAAALWLLLPPAALASGSAAPAAADPALEARVMALAHDLRCLVCQNQSIAESNAPLAIDLRNQVREQLAAGQDEAAVRRYMVERYGDFVLYRPPLKPATLLLWGGPALLLAGGLFALGRRLRQRQQTPPPPLSDAQREQARRLLDDVAPKEQAPS